MSDMSLENAVRSRHSIRGFLDKPVPEDLLLKVFDIARWAPSGTNIQPWQTYVASGTTRDKMRAELMRLVQNKEKPNPDHPDTGGRLGDPWKSRRRDCAKVLYDAMGIQWEDKAGRARASFRNFELFDAPHVAFLCMDENFGMQSAADVGMYTQTLMLAMTANGLASCAQGTMRHYPDLVRATFGLPGNISVLFGISFGYEDTAASANEARTERVSLEDTVTFMN